ncbi:MAG: PDZ domain-containing protein [Pseudomonadota bacterium]
MRPWFGASGQSVTAEIATSLGLGRPVGVLLNEVYPGGPADRAGLRVGDIVTEVESHEVDDSESLRFRVATLPIGRTAAVAALRQGTARQFAVELAPPPENAAARHHCAARQQPADRRRGRQPVAGAGRRAAARRPAARCDRARGPAGSRAAQLGLTRGDILLKVNDHDVGAAKQLEAQLAERAAKWRLSVRRGREVLNVVVNG